MSSVALPILDFTCFQNASLPVHRRDLRLTTLLMMRNRKAHGVADGDLPAGTDARRLATYFDAVMQGLSLEAQDCARREDVRGTVETAMDVLDS